MVQELRGADAHQAMQDLGPDQGIEVETIDMDDLDPELLAQFEAFQQTQDVELETTPPELSGIEADRADLQARNSGYVSDKGAESEFVREALDDGPDL